MAKRTAWRRAPGGYRLRRGGRWGGDRHQCVHCGHHEPATTFAEKCPHCSHPWWLRRRPQRRHSGPEVRLQKAQRALDAALDRLVLEGKRVARLRTRVRLLAAAVAKPQEERQAAALKAAETRRTRRGVRRGITVRREEATGT